MATAFRFEALPGEVFNGVVGFLTSCDLLALSHVNRLLLTELLAPNGDLWTQRASCIGPPVDSLSAKRRYFQIRTFRFGGLRNYLPEDNHIDWRAREKAAYGGAAPFNFTVQSVLARSSFSFSLWFALLPGGPRVKTGGILLGAQSNPFMNSFGRGVNFDAQFIQVDPEANLYCSVSHAKAIVKKNLDTERWYHLVLVFDKANASDTRGTESVYLDGQEIHSSETVLHRLRQNTPYWQVGSGYTSSRVGEPRPDFHYWYGFYGMIDDFAIWKQALSAEQIQELHQGREVCEAKPFWSLRTSHAAPTFEGIVDEVGCARPQERHCVPFAV